jgi:hypothetical protein
MLAWLALTLQLQLTAPPAAPATEAVRARAEHDSLRDVDRAHDAQAGFERGRRNVLPWGMGRGDACDARIGRFCWWYEPSVAGLPEEPDEVRQRLAARRPGDPWIAGMRVYYHVDDGDLAGADSAARDCRATSWWCAALQGYAADARGDMRAADSLFAGALAAMPDSTRCRWTDIAVLLPLESRDRYERLDCAGRREITTRYWMLATPRISAPANEWRTAWYGRRVSATLLAGAVTPHRLSWGRDLEELLLRYGWPVAWSRIVPASMSMLEPEILGHDPAPSFSYGPDVAMLEGVKSDMRTGWRLDDVHGESRLALPTVHRLAPMVAQLARFPRGDSTLLAAAWSTTDDSLRHPSVTVGAAYPDGGLRARLVDSLPSGHALVTVAGRPALAGVELSDSATGTFARVRLARVDPVGGGALHLSDLLVYRPAGPRPPALAEALALAVPGDTVSTDRPIGLYWEVSGARGEGVPDEVAILVERIDHGLFRSARQRLGLLDPDSPVRITWGETAEGVEDVVPHALSLDLGELPAGRYRVTITHTPAGRPPSAASRELELLAP